MKKKPLPDSLEEIMDEAIVKIIYPSLHPDAVYTAKQFKKFVSALRPEYNTSRYDRIAYQLYKREQK